MDLNAGVGRFHAHISSKSLADRCEECSARIPARIASGHGHVDCDRIHQCDGAGSEDLGLHRG